MTNEEKLALIKKTKIVPVVVFNNIDEVLPKMEALVNGGLPCAEITFRTECAAEAIKLAVKNFPTAFIGAGTVINRNQCEQAIVAGAQFIVSPGFSPEVADCCAEHNMLYLPGIVTPTEAMAAIAKGLTTLKFFPASNYGGLKTIKAICAAFGATITYAKRLMHGKQSAVLQFYHSCIIALVENSHLAAHVPKDTRPTVRLPFFGLRCSDCEEHYK